MIGPYSKCKNFVCGLVIIESQVSDTFPQYIALDCRSLIEEIRGGGVAFSVDYFEGLV